MRIHQKSSNLTVDRADGPMPYMKYDRLLSDVVHNDCMSAAMQQFRKASATGRNLALLLVGTFCSKGILKFILILHIFSLKNAKFT